MSLNFAQLKKIMKFNQLVVIQRMSDKVLQNLGTFHNRSKLDTELEAQVKISKLI